MLDAVARDISPDGLQVRCDRKTMQVIHPGGEFITKDNAPDLEVVFSLVTGGKAHEIRTACRMFYFILLPEEDEHDVAFGAQFLAFQGTSKKYIEKYISDMIMPVENTVLQFLDQPRSKKEIIAHAKIEPDEAGKLLAQLRDQGDIVSYGPAKSQSHVQSGSATAMILEQLDRIEKSIAKLSRRK